MVAITLRFPLGVYHAQAQADVGRAEWPPHPVRLIAALVAAAHGGPADRVDAARTVIDRLAAAGAPVIVAPRHRRLSDPGAAQSNDELRATELRGASRWAPRNHELGELKKGISPRDLGRGRAEVHKVGVAIGDRPVSFVWPDLTLDDGEATALRRVAEDVTVVGTSRSPVLADVHTDDLPAGTSGDDVAWRPAPGTTGMTSGTASVRVPNARTLSQLDAWHARRSVAPDRGGAPAKAPLVVAPRLGSVVAYVHDRATLAPDPLDPEHWGDMLVLRVHGDVIPKGPATFAFARATRKALLDTYAPPGQPGEAPAVLRGRDAHPHAAFVPLSFVAPLDAQSPGAARADGHILGLAVVLPSAARCPDVAAARDAVTDGLARLITATTVRVPGVGDVALAPLGAADRQQTLQEDRYRRASRCWTTATPIVHSRYRTGKRADALLDQVAAECRDVGLPVPVRVQVRRGSRLRGAPALIRRDGLPPSWTGPLNGPQAHVDLWFDREVRGPVILGRARHFGLGLCLPFDDEEAA